MHAFITVICEAVYCKWLRACECGPQPASTECTPRCDMDHTAQADVWPQHLWPSGSTAVAAHLLAENWVCMLVYSAYTRQHQTTSARQSIVVSILQRIALSPEYHAMSSIQANYCCILLSTVTWKYSWVLSAYECNRHLKRSKNVTSWLHTSLSTILDIMSDQTLVCNFERPTVRASLLKPRSANGIVRTEGKTTRLS